MNVATLVFFLFTFILRIIADISFFSHHVIYYKLSVSSYVKCKDIKIARGQVHSLDPLLQPLT